MVTNPDDVRVKNVLRKVASSRSYRGSLLYPGAITFSGGVLPEVLTGSIELPRMSFSGVYLGLGVQPFDEVRVRIGGVSGYSGTLMVASGATSVSFPIPESARVTSEGIVGTLENEYSFEFCKREGGEMGCSLPLVTHIPNPVAGYMNLGGMKPLNMRERMEIDMERRKMEDICNFNREEKLFACVDYRFGKAKLRVKAGMGSFDVTTNS